MQLSLRHTLRHGEQARQKAKSRRQARTESRRAARGPSTERRQSKLDPKVLVVRLHFRLARLTWLLCVQTEARPSSKRRRWMADQVPGEDSEQVGGLIIPSVSLVVHWVDL